MLKLKIMFTSGPAPPGNASSNTLECPDSEMLLYRNESSLNCACPSPQLFHCDDLMDCRFLAHWKSKSVREQTKC